MTLGSFSGTLMPFSMASRRLAPDLKTSAARSFAGLPCSQVERNTGPPDSAARASKSPAASAAAPATVLIKLRRSTESMGPPPLKIRNQKLEIGRQDPEVRSQNAGVKTGRKSKIKKFLPSTFDRQLVLISGLPFPSRLPREIRCAGCFPPGPRREFFRPVSLSLVRAESKCCCRAG